MIIRGKIFLDLIRAGANVDAKTMDGQSAIIKACIQNMNVDTLNALIQSGANVNCKDNNGRTALINSVYFGLFEEANILIRAGANSQQEDDWTALILASWNGECARAQTLIKQNPQIIDYPDNDGRTALMWAARNGHVDCVKTLIYGGANVNAKDHFKMTVLVFAVSTCKRYPDGSLMTIPRCQIRCTDENLSKVVQVLIEAGVDISAKDDSNQSAVESCQAYPRCKKILVKNLTNL